MAKEKKPLAALILGAKPKDEDYDEEVKQDMGQRVLDAIANEDPIALCEAIKDILDY